MYFTGLFTQVAQSVKSNYLLMVTAKDGLSVTMEVMITRLTEPENRARKSFLAQFTLAPLLILQFSTEQNQSVKLSFIIY